LATCGFGQKAAKKQSNEERADKSENRGGKAKKVVLNDEDFPSL
jgi:hypothetical protein